MFGYGLGLVVGDEEQIGAAEFSTGSKERWNLAFARPLAGNRVGDLDELDDFAVAGQAEVDVI